MSTWVLYVLAYLLLIGFFVIERFVRVGETRDMSHSATDHGSTAIISVVMGIAFVLVPLTPLLNWWHIGDMRRLWVGIVGVVLGVAGLAVRYQAFTTLGRFFTRTLKQTDEHQLVTWGIYKHIRHPGYASDLLIFIGASLAMNNWITTVVVIAMFIPAYAYRIHIEEHMLSDAFGQAYTDYQRTSKRLIPGIW